MKRLIYLVAVLTAVFILHELFCTSNEGAGLTTTVTPSDQSIFQTIQYWHKSRALVLTFRSGAIYEYQSVPYSTFSTLVHSSSKGAYFNRCIRTQYACARIE